VTQRDDAVRIERGSRQNRHGNIASMVDRLVLVNGLPASGKTTLSLQLAAHLAVPCVSKDSIMELLGGAFPAAAASSLGRIAMQTAWGLVAAMPGTVILESWWFKHRDLDLVKDDLGNCCASAVVEVWCDVPADLARQRFVRRNRPAPYQDAQRLARNWPDWASRAEPLGVGLTVRVRTDQPVDVEAVAAAVMGPES
jgi:predicted kinase